MNLKKRFIILSLCIVLICCAGTVCAADSNNTVDIVSDVDSNEEYKFRFTGSKNNYVLDKSVKIKIV